MYVYIWQFKFDWNKIKNLTNFYIVSIYFSDLNTMLFFFPKIKSHLKSHSKENHQGIITPSMHSFPRESFQKIYNIFHKIISTFFFFFNIHYFSNAPRTFSKIYYPRFF